MTFGERLRELRKKKNYTQEELAKLIGVAKSTLTGYEKGNREPDFFKIKKLTEILDVNADYLLGISDSSTSENSSIEISNNTIKSAKVLTEIYNTTQDLTEEEQLYILDMINTYKKHLNN